MRIKHKAITLLIMIAMLLTFMPALAFANEEAESYKAVVTYVDGKSADDLTYNTDFEEYNFTEIASSISILKNDSVYKTFTKGADGEFVCGEEILAIGCDGWDTEEGIIQVDFWNFTDAGFDFGFFQDFKVTFTETFETISFNRSSITLDSISSRDEDDGGVYYNIFSRGGKEFFIEGDAIDVTYKDTGVKKTFKYNSNENCFENGNERFYAYAQPTLDDEAYPNGQYSFKIGLNKEAIFIGVGQHLTTVDLIIDNSGEKAAADAAAAEREKAAAAAAAAEAAAAEAAANEAFNGIRDASVPSVKGAKAKAAKKSFTVNWKKASKKKSKKFDKVEVQYSMNPSFPRTETKSKLVKYYSSFSSEQ